MPKHDLQIEAKVTLEHDALMEAIKAYGRQQGWVVTDVKMSTYTVGQYKDEMNQYRAVLDIAVVPQTPITYRETNLADMREVGMGGRGD